MKISRVLLLLSILSALSMLSGCQSVQALFTTSPRVITQEATVAAPGVSVAGAMPPGIPDALPVWPGSEVQPGGRAKQGTVAIVTDTTDNYNDVVSGVAVGFERAGWKITESAEEASATVLDVSGHTYEGLVTLYQTDAGTSIEYLLTKATP